MKEKGQKLPTPPTVGLFLAWRVRRGECVHGSVSCHVLSGSNARGYFSSWSYIINSLDETYLGFES